MSYRNRYGGRHYHGNSGPIECECKSKPLLMTFCLFVIQLVLICFITTYSWENMRNFGNTEVTGNTPLGPYLTVGPYGFCITGNMSTIPTRCFNPIRAEDYEKKTFVQKLCFQRNKSVAGLCNCITSESYNHAKTLVCKGRYSQGHYNPRYFMMESGCGTDEIPSVDMDGVSGCKKCEEVIECTVHGILTPPLNRMTGCDKRSSMLDICQPSVFDTTVEIGTRILSISTNSSTNSSFTREHVAPLTLRQVNPVYINAISKMQDMGNAAFTCMILGVMFSFVATYFSPFGHENMPMRKMLISVMHGKQAGKEFQTGTCYCTDCCFIYKKIDLKRVPKPMVIVWMCLYFFLLLFESLAMLTTIYLVSFWLDEGVPRMQGFARTYLNIYKYYGGKTFTGTLDGKVCGHDDPFCLWHVRGFIGSFWAIGGLMFFHLLSMFILSVNLVCNKAGPIGTELKQGEVGLECTESPSKPTLAAPDRNSWSLGALFYSPQWNATDEPNAPDRSSRSPDSVEIQMDKNDGRVQCYHCQNYYFQNYNFCPHCGTRSTPKKK